MREHKKILIVEDEPIIADDLAYIIGGFGYEVTDMVLSVSQALESIRDNKPDLILLDIALKGDDDGIDLANIINQDYQIPFLFLTSNADQLTINRVKKTMPAGFILKPFREKELKTQLAIALYEKDEFPSKNVKGESLQERIFVKVGNDMVRIMKDEILYAKADGNYTFIYTDTKEYCVTQNLKNFIQKVDATNFLRVHRSYLVNLKKITKISEGYIHLTNHTVPVGRVYIKSLKKKIQFI